MKFRLVLRDFEALKSDLLRRGRSDDLNQCATEAFGACFGLRYREERQKGTFDPRGVETATRDQFGRTV